MHWKKLKCPKKLAFGTRLQKKWRTPAKLRPQLEKPTRGRFLPLKAVLKLSRSWRSELDYKKKWRTPAKLRPQLEKPTKGRFLPLKAVLKLSRSWRSELDYKKKWSAFIQPRQALEVLATKVSFYLCS